MESKLFASALVNEMPAEDILLLKMFSMMVVPNVPPRAIESWMRDTMEAMLEG